MWCPKWNTRFININFKRKHEFGEEMDWAVSADERVAMVDEYNQNMLCMSIELPENDQKFY